MLADFEAVSFAGAAVPDDLGDRLVAAGVNLISIYGTTETGSLLNSRRDFAGDKAWNWLRAEGPIVDYSVMEDRGSRTFELVVLDGWPPKISTYFIHRVALTFGRLTTDRGLPIFFFFFSSLRSVEPAR